MHAFGWVAQNREISRTSRSGRYPLPQVYLGHLSRHARLFFTAEKPDIALATIRVSLGKTIDEAVCTIAATNRANSSERL
jgi:hypothetical protein